MILLPERSSLGGVTMKRAEAVTLSLTGSGLFPRYHTLPEPSSLLQLQPGGEGGGAGGSRLAGFMAEGGVRWDAVPERADPASAMPAKRKQRKREQVEGMVRCCAALMLALDQRPAPGGRRTFVDFCGGAGHVSLLVAWLFPWWDVVCVDLKERHLELARLRAAELGVGNYRTWCGDVRAFAEPFSVGSALHACGSATDMTLDAILRAGACMVVCPCCVGKLTSDKEIRGTGPRSKRFKERLEDARAGGGDPYAELVRAGDFGDSVEGDVGWWRRAAKSLLEADRMACVAESWLEPRPAQGGGVAAGEGGGSGPQAHGGGRDDAGQGEVREGGSGYSVRLCKMEPLTASPKNDIIVAWRALSEGGQRALQSLFGHEDARRYHEPAGERSTEGGGGAAGQAPYLGDFGDDATFVSLQRRIAAFKEAAGEQELLIDGLKGNRERKMVHAIAESLALAHKSQGKGSSRSVRVWKGVGSEVSAVSDA